MTIDASRAVLTCPVCGSAARQSSAGACVTCGTDLSILTRLQRARELLAAAAPAAPPNAPAGWRRETLWAFAGAAIGIGLTLAMGAPSIDQAATAAAVQPSPIAPLPARPPSDRNAAELNALAARLSALEGLTVEQSGGAIAVAPRDSLFASGSAALGARERRWVERIAAELATERRSLRILLRGHTDGTALRSGGSWASNWALGLDRARAAALALGANRASMGAHTIETTSAGDEPVKVGTPLASRRAVVIVISLQTTSAIDDRPYKGPLERN